MSQYTKIHSRFFGFNMAAGRMGGRESVSEGVRGVYVDVCDVCGGGRNS